VFTVVKMVQVQLRVPQGTVDFIDELIKKKKFSTRSEAIKSMITFYEEREKTREFYEELKRRAEELDNHPEKAVKFDDIKWD